MRGPQLEKVYMKLHILGNVSRFLGHFKISRVLINKFIYKKIFNENWFENNVARCNVHVFYRPVTYIRKLLLYYDLLVC